MATKAATSKKKNKPNQKLSDEEQSKRFMETARELGVDESGENFERAFREITERSKGRQSR